MAAADTTGIMIDMGAQKTDVVSYLSPFLGISIKAAQAYPELPTMSEQAILLTAMAISDSDGFVSVEDWVAYTGVSESTLLRFAGAYASFGLMGTTELEGGRVRVTNLAIQRLEGAIN
jgi:hypothetical protein